MDLREILVVLRPDTPADGVLAVAGALATEYRTVLRGLCVFSTPAPTLAECYVIGTAAVDEVVDHLAHEAESLLAPLHAQFLAARATCGAEGDWTTIERLATTEAPRHARLVDLVILPRPRADDADALHIAESFLIEGGTPCLLVPDALKDAGKFTRIAVAWNGTREAKRALDEALPLLRAAETVEIVIVGDPPQVPLHDRTDTPALHLARHGVTADTTYVPDGGDAGEAILDRCAAIGADLLVAGAFGHRRLAEAILGGVTRTLLLHAPLPVLMAR